MATRTRLVGLLLVVVLPISISRQVRAADTISIASWNIRNISNNSRSDAELGIIALIIFRYDFIACQEVLDPEVIKRLQSILKEDFQIEYEIDVSAKVGHSKKERYAFMWRKGKIKQTKPGQFYSDVGDKFEREPYFASFRSGNFDWTIATIHLLFGANEAERRPELRLLDDVYRSIRDAGAEKDVLICGDFNFDPKDDGWKQLKAEDEMSFAISPPAKTTIAGISLYDNFWWPKTSKEVVNGSGTVFEFDELMYPHGSRKEINRLTSDHRPVSIRVIVDGQDDD